MLTRRQLDALRFIAGHVEVHGRVPTYDELASGVGVRFKSTGHRLVQCLIERGALVIETTATRGNQHVAQPGHRLAARPSLPRGPDGAARYFVAPVMRDGRVVFHNGGSNA